jgi:hypothetical protein
VPGDHDLYLRGAATPRRGYVLDTTTRAMGVALDGLRLEQPGLELGTLDWETYVRTFELPPGLLRSADRDAFHLRVARLDRAPATASLAFDHEGDCGVLQATCMAERLYATLGFRDLGRPVELVPGPALRAAAAPR